MKRLKYLALFIAVFGTFCCGRGTESEIPAAQEWAFEMEKVWEIDRLGQDRLLRPAEPRIADDGTLYFHDFERHLSYIVDGDGNLISTFAPRGDSEGEVPMYINCFPAGDHVAICAMDKLHFFSRQGQFVKAVPNNPFVRFPLAFKNENEFWVAPGALGDSPGDLAEVTYINLDSGEETVVHQFERTAVESRPTGGAVVLGLTPQIKMGLDRQADRVYFGKNTDTVIYRLARGEDRAETFSFAAQRYPVSETDKRNHFARFDIPEEHLAGMVEALPDQMAYYDRIQVVGGQVYLLGSQGLGGMQTELEVNVFSPDGRHLYYGRIRVEDEWHIAGSAGNLQLHDGIVYAVLEDATGDKKIVKYAVTLPPR